MSRPQFYAPRMEHWRMTSARYDTTLLSDDLIRALAALEQLERIQGLMFAHIGAATPGFIEAVQATMRPGTTQGTPGVHTSEVSDPTLAAVALRSKGHDLLWRAAALAAEISRTTRELERLVTSQRREADAYDIEQVKKAHRCQGDPTCQSIALQDGLCGPCRAAGWGRATSTSSGGAVRAADGRTGARTDVSRLYEAIGIKDHGAIAGAPRLLDTSRIIEREAS